MTALEDLTQFGFEPITEWIMKGDKIGPRSFVWKDHGGWLYAFVVDGEVKYIGFTNRVLRSRMMDYAHIKNSQTTRLRELIVAELMAGRTVKVIGWKEFNKETLVAEEKRLRALCGPPWNRE